MTSALDLLAEQARQDLQAMAYPSRPWIRPLAHPSGQHVYDVIIVGAGQAGMTAALTLLRDGIPNLLLVDRSREGYEGPWETYARMPRLRTPKYQVGIETGLPSLSVRAWFEARYGKDAWGRIDRVPRTDWMAYLRWYRAVAGLPVRNDTAVEAIEPDGAVFALSTIGPAGTETLLARRVVLATGFEGAGPWYIPEQYAATIPAGLRSHSNTAIDFARLRGKRIGILGHGASAFDNAVVALEHGARSVDLCFRRSRIPTVNPHRQLEYAGLLKHYPELPDATRWTIARYFDAVDQPPVQESFDRTHAFPNFRMLAGCPWARTGVEGGAVFAETPRGRLAFDYVIFATGAMIDLATRPELAAIAPDLACWCDRYPPPSEAAHPFLGEYPYLGPHFELQERVPGTAPYLARLYGFSFVGYVSMGPHSTSASALKHSAPRLATGITRAFLAEQEDAILPDLLAYAETELRLDGRTGLAAATHSAVD